MALTIISSNRVETLQTRLVQQLSAQPLREPFVSETILVPTFAMSRWLNLRIAQQQGIAANISYLQPAKWIWQLAGCVIEDIPHEDPYSADKLGWRIFSLLASMLSLPAFASLKKYLKDDIGDVKRWQLSQRIAVSFERYQQYRPELIRDWSDNRDNHWQAILWRKLVSQTGLPDRTASIARMIECLNRDSNIISLPQRVNLFALSSLTPVFVETIEALSRHTDIIIYQHNPSLHYWADLKDEKSLARLRLANASTAEYYQTGNELLASWGKQGQVLQDLMLARLSSSNEIDCSNAPGQESLLQSIQQSIFTLDETRRRIAVDDSLRLHACHSPMRECQVLHDQLLGLLDREPDLAGEDILVMVPDISLYAPYIESVFQRDETALRPFLAWNISDITVADNHPLARSFLALLKLPESRFSFSEIMAFLDLVEIRDQFNIDQQMLEDIYRLMQKARVRWGIDGKHRQSFDLPPTPQNTWQQAWERLFAGYAVADSVRWQQIAAIAEMDSDNANSIAHLRHFIERLDYWRHQLNKPATASHWQSRLNLLLEEFFARQQDQEGLQTLRDVIDRLDVTSGAELSPDLINYWMGQQLASQELPGRLFSGGVSFCGMRPMRNIPFPVICLLGMDDGAFPRRDAHLDFDLMAQSWRPGDPRKADEDRYLMLETLLCARQYLYISYCGRSLRDNSRRQPSVLVQELLDFVDAKFECDSDPDQALSHAITSNHAMQAFSSKNFSSPNRGYDRYWYQTAKCLSDQSQRQSPGPWTSTALDSGEADFTQIELGQLRRFYRHPIQYFFTTRLGISLPEEQLLEDEEPFQLQGLQKWEVSQRLAKASIDGELIDPGVLLAEGLLPHGQAAYSAVAAIQNTNSELFESLAKFAKLPAKTLQISSRLSTSTLLFGEVEGYYPGIGLMQFSSSRVKGKNLLASWLDHLALCANALLAETECSLLITAKNKFRFDFIEAQTAKALLGEYVSIFSLGALCPLPIFPDSSYAWSAATDADAAMRAAMKCWNSGLKNVPPGENENAYIRLAMHNQIADPLLDSAFAEYAKRIFTPLNQHIKEL